MFLPNDLQSRLKGLRHSRATDTGESMNPQLVAWMVLLLLGAMAIIAIVIVSFQRFSYWKDLDARLMEQSGAITYDADTLEKVLEEFEARSKRTEEILLALSIVEEEAATTTATSSIATSSPVSEGE